MQDFLRLKFQIFPMIITQTPVTAGATHHVPIEASVRWGFGCGFETNGRVTVN